MNEALQKIKIGFLLMTLSMSILSFSGCTTDGDDGDEPSSISLEEHDSEDYNCLISVAVKGVNKCDNKLEVIFSDWGNGRCKKRTVTFRITNQSST